VQCSQIDFFLIKKSNKNIHLDGKVLPGENLITQHILLVMDVRVKRERRE